MAIKIAESATRRFQVHKERFGPLFKSVVFFLESLNHHCSRCCVATEKGFQLIVL